MKPCIGGTDCFHYHGTMLSCSYDLLDTCLPNCGTVTGKP